MNKRPFFRVGIGVALLLFLFISCATSPPPAPEKKPEPEKKAESAVTPPAPPAPPERKTKTITVKIPRVTRQTIKFPDGTDDEYTVYTYSTDGRLLLKEELFDSATKDILEYVEYKYQGDLLVERAFFDGNRKLKSRRTYQYNNNLLAEEAQYDKDNNLQTKSVFLYDPQNRRIEWRTLDASGSALGISRYSYEKENTPVKTELLGPGGNLEMTITTTYSNNRKNRELFTLPDGKVEREIVYRYDDQGRLLGETTYSATKAKVGSIAYEYPADSMVPIREVHLDGRDRPKKIIVYEYAYREESRIVYE